MDNKVLSFIVPAYNSEETLNCCLDSFLVPSLLGKIEVFVVNDGSTDNTESIAQTYAEQYHCFHLINKANGGHGSVINYAVNIISGKYFKIIDSDDHIKSDNLAEFINALEIFNADVVFTHFRTIDFSRICSFDEYWQQKQ